jgi:cobalt-zinc-cadmium resistance protein CzcA
VRVLKQVQGVADVVSIGGFVKEFHVEVDPEKLYSLGLSLDDVSDALSKSNRNVGGGLMRRGEQSFIIRGIGLLRNPQEIQDVVVAMRGKAPVTIGDVARVAQSHTPRQGSVGMDDQNDVVQGIVLLKRGANPPSCSMTFMPRSMSSTAAACLKACTWSPTMTAPIWWATRSRPCSTTCCSVPR